MRTKWEILEARKVELEGQLEDLKATMQWMLNAPCPHSCIRCGKNHGTEADFAKHYLIPDERYLNLGHCPTNTNATAIP